MTGEACADFESRRAGHALQRDEMIEVVYRLVTELFRANHTAIYEKVREDWRKETEQERRMVE